MGVGGDGQRGPYVGLGWVMQRNGVDGCWQPGTTLAMTLDPRPRGPFSTTSKCKMLTRRLVYVSVWSWQEPDVMLHQGIWGSRHGQGVGIPVRREQRSRASSSRELPAWEQHSGRADPGTPGGLSGRSWGLLWLLGGGTGHASGEGGLPFILNCWGLQTLFLIPWPLPS